MVEIVDAGSAETEEFCRDVRPQSTLAMGGKPIVTIVAERLTQWSARQRVSVSKALAITYCRRLRGAGFCVPVLAKWMLPIRRACASSRCLDSA